MGQLQTNSARSARLRGSWCVRGVFIISPTKCTIPDPPTMWPVPFPFLLAEYKVAQQKADAERVGAALLALLGWGPWAAWKWQQCPPVPACPLQPSCQPWWRWSSSSLRTYLLWDRWRPDRCQLIQPEFWPSQVFSDVQLVCSQVKSSKLLCQSQMSKLGWIFRSGHYIPELIPFPFLNCPVLCNTLCLTAYWFKQH